MSLELQPMAEHYYCHMSPSVSRDQNTALTFWSRDTDVYLTCVYIYIRFDIILTQLYVNFSRQEHQIEVL